MLTDNLFIVSHERGTFSGRVQSIISKLSLGTLPQSRVLPRGEELTQGRELVNKTGPMVVGIPQRPDAKKHLPIVTLCLIVTGNRTAHPDHLV